MKKAISAVLSFAFLVSFSPAVGLAQAASCPDVDAAKAMLKQMTARTDEVQAPRSLAGARQDVQSPRSQDIQSPRSQDGKTQAAAATRGADMKKATTLVTEAEAACKAGKADVASEKAKAAMSLLKK